MRRPLIILAFSLLNIPGFCQMEISSIRNDEDAISFVKSYADQHKLKWTHFGFYVFNKRTGRILKDSKPAGDTILRSTWIKEDFNEDGIPDLIYAGYLSKDDLAVIAFISSQDSISCQFLGNIFNHFSPTIVSTELYNGKKLLRITPANKRNKEIRDWRKIPLFNETDRLVYRNGGFIELNEKSKSPLHFDSVHFSNYSPWGNFRSPVEITIFKTGLAEVKWLYYEIHDTIYSNRIFQFDIDKNTIKELGELLSYIEFPNLKEGYGLFMISDLSTARTEVFYNGKQKKVTDYGCHGNFGLNLLYNKLGALMKEAQNRFYPLQSIKVKSE